MRQRNTSCAAQRRWEARDFSRGRFTYIQHKRKGAGAADIWYAIQQGFDAMADAEAMLNILGEDPTKFAYVKFDNEYYAVGLDGGHMAVVALDYLFEYPNGGKLKKITENTRLRFYYTGFNTTTKWKDKSLHDLRDHSIHTINVFTHPNMTEILSDRVINNIQVLFAGSMVDTMFRSEDLKSLENYFDSDPAKKLQGQKDITYYNPFTGEYRIRSKT